MLLDEPGEARNTNIRRQVSGAFTSALTAPSTGARNVSALFDPASGFSMVYPQAIDDRRQIVG